MQGSAGNSVSPCANQQTHAQIKSAGSFQIIKFSENSSMEENRKYSREDGKLSKNARIKAQLFRSKKRTPKKTEDEGHEIKRIKGLLENNKLPEPLEIKKFAQLPISRKTIWGLKESGYEEPTEIQREALGLALRGMDILGGAKTGSGKTLAFIIPVLEKLFLNLWSSTDGLGALIITPTRELAFQIFETLRNVGRKHEFSAGLIIGGKDLKSERKRMDLLNIIICTPGRLLQHMDENPNFDCSNLQVLVLDEADRCLDLGFERDMNAIIDNLPIERQTLLFSATQTKSVKDLARLSLKSPVFVSVHERAEHSTPEALAQSYIVSPVEDKLDMLWSFIKHHKKKKILVFLSSCKQVRFVNLLFCRMRPGTSVLALYGSLHQLRRMAVYQEFSKKESAVLLATDIAARGLDFPGVDWVLQLDCPEDATTYIHRAGRTARYKQGGESLLVLTPFEEQTMVEHLKEKRIPIQKIEVNQRRFQSVRRKFEALLARDINLKECAQRAFKAYIKSVFLMKDKKVFDVSQLNLDAFASSLGLAVAPRVRFLQKRGLSGQAQSHDVDDDDEEGEPHEQPRRKTESKHTLDFSLPGEDSDSDGDTLFKSKKPAELNLDSDDEFSQSISLPSDKIKKPKSKAAVAKKLLKKKISTNKKTTFDEEGEAVLNLHKERQSEAAKAYEREDASGIDLARAKEILKEEDHVDKKLFRDRVRAKHRDERLKKRAARKGKTKEELEEEMVKMRESSSDDEGGVGPDLSWLPDPDKVYGEEDEPEDSNSEGEREESFPRKRRKMEVDDDEEEEDDYEDDDDDSEDEEEENTGKMEQFALQLLSK